MRRVKSSFFTFRLDLSRMKTRPLSSRSVLQFVIIESIRLLGKVVILNGLDADLSLYEMSDFHYIEFAIISDSKTISPCFYILSLVLGFILNHFIYAT